MKYQPDKYGKIGFKPVKKVEIRTINVSQLEKLAAGKKEINLGKLGLEKVLGKGRIDVSIEVMAKAFSKKAVEKIEAAGGKIVVFGEPEEKIEELPKNVSEEDVIERAA